MLDIIRKRLWEEWHKSHLCAIVQNHRAGSVCAIAELLQSLQVSDAALDLERFPFSVFSSLVILSCNLCTFIGFFVEDCRDFSIYVTLLHISGHPFE